MRERCLVLVKPDGISRGLLPVILQHIESSGLVILEQKLLTATEEQCSKHYNVKVRNYGATEKQIVEYLSRSYLKNKNVCVLVVTGENVMNKAYNIKVKIRNNFCLDTRKKSKAEGRAWHNIMHSSESVEDAGKEMEVWLKK